MPCLLLLLLLITALPLHADPRRLHNASAPAWLASVGKLTVPGQKWEDGEHRHYEENCSGILLTSRSLEHGTGTGFSARYVISAWHCLEYYTDLSRAISFSLPDTDVQRQASVVISGGNMAADWTLLRLDQPIKVPARITLSTEPAIAGATMLTSAGYSRDLAAADGGRLLSYHPLCSVTATAPALVTTDCRAAKGASGGPMVTMINGEARVLGVLSSGDGQQVSLYIPSAEFARRVGPYLRR